MGRPIVTGIAVAAFLTATLLAPFAHLHAGSAPHDHVDRPSQHAHGVVHTHFAAHRHGARGETGATSRWHHQDGTPAVSLDTLLSEPSKSPMRWATLEAAYVPPDPVTSARRPFVTLPRAHGPPAAFPVIGRAPPV